MHAPSTPASIAWSPIGRVRQIFGGRMEGNAILLALSSAVTGALGLVFWMVAEQFFPTAVIGRASAIISSATMLSTVSGLALGGMYERFLADTGRWAGRTILWGLLGTATLGLGTGGLFLLLGPSDDLFSSAIEAAAFPLTVAVLTVYALLDPILVAIGKVRWLVAKNIGLSVVKLLPLPLLAGTGAALAITGSWAALALIVSLILGFLVMRFVRRHPIRVEHRLPALGGLVRHHLAVVAIMLMSVAVPLALPLIVITSLGAETAAYFNISWILVSAVGLVLSTMMSSYVVEASTHPEHRPDQTRRMIRLMAIMSACGAVGLALIGPLLLSFVGPGYTAGTGYLLVMAPALILQCTISFFGAFSRILSRLRLLVVTQLLGSIGMIGGALLLVRPLGMTGVALAMLATDLVCVAIIIVPLVRRGRLILSGASDTFVPSPSESSPGPEGPLL